MVNISNSPVLSTQTSAREAVEQPVIFLESTHRILKTLTALIEFAPTVKVHIARELTKLHEEMLIGTAEEILAILEAEPVRQKGEFVVIVDIR